MNSEKLKSALKCAPIIVVLLLSFICSSCSKSETSKIVGKWQVVSYEYADGSVKKAGDVFYNFQSGSFSAICAYESYEYSTFFGNYALQDGKISIILLPEYVGDTYDKYIGWPNNRCEFVIDELQAKSMRLRCDDYAIVLRRY